MGGMVVSGNALYGTTSIGGNELAPARSLRSTPMAAGFKSSRISITRRRAIRRKEISLYGQHAVWNHLCRRRERRRHGVFHRHQRQQFHWCCTVLTPVSDGNGHYTAATAAFRSRVLFCPASLLYGTTLYGGTNGVGTAYEIILPSPPSLNIAKSGGGVKISSPSAATNFVLQSNSTSDIVNVVKLQWRLNDDGTNKSIGIIPTAGNAFFRLLNTNSP